MSNDSKHTSDPLMDNNESSSAPDAFDDVAHLDALEGLEQPDEQDTEDDLAELAQLDAESLTSREDQMIDLEADLDLELESLQAMDDDLNLEVDQMQAEEIVEKAEASLDLRPAKPQKIIQIEDLNAEDWAGYSESRLIKIIEAAIFAYGKPLSLEKMAEMFQDSMQIPSKNCLKWIVQQLQAQYQGRGVEIVHVRSGYRLQSIKDTTAYVLNLWDERPNKYSRATLETLALIAYRQPITRGEIEDVRGVSVSSYIIKSMLEREWIRVVGHRDVPGRPALYATTKAFLDYFCLDNLDQLPSLAEIREIEDLEPNLDLSLDGNNSDDSSLQGGAGKEATFDALVENMRTADTTDMLQEMDAELAEDLTEAAAINDNFEALLASQRAAMLAEAEQKEAENQFASETDMFDEDNQANQEKPPISLQTAQEASSEMLTEQEQLEIIQAKLAAQQALIEQRDKEDSNESSE